MSKLLDIINNISSSVILECTRTHLIRLRKGFILNADDIKVYRKSTRLPRNCIMLDPAHWKIAAQKYQKNQNKPIYVKNKTM